MPEVYNWQLGRKMLYPYEERHPKWQFAFVFNINRCLACQTCSMADKSTWLFSKGQEYMCGTMWKPSRTAGTPSSTT
jgi:nitrate reductase beta subunit